MTLRITPDDALRYLGDSQGGDMRRADQFRSLYHSLGAGDIDQQTAINNELRDIQARMEQEGKLEEYASIAEAKPPEADENGDGKIDDEFAVVCAICELNKPCCLKEFTVTDKNDSTRKVTWPILEGQPSKLLMVTKDPYLGNPSAEVEVKLTDKKPCIAGHSQRPATVHSNFAAGEDRATDSEVVTVTNNMAVSSAISMLLPENVAVLVMASEVCFGVGLLDVDGRPAVSQFQCMSFSLSDQQVTVQPIPHCDIQANITGVSGVKIPFGGRNSFIPDVYNTLEGSIVGELGNQTFTLGVEQKSSMGPQSPEAPISDDNQPKAPKGPLMTLLEKMYDSVADFASKGTNEAIQVEEVSTTAIASLKLELEAEIIFGKIKLSGKENTPDLLLDVDSGSAGLKLSVEGTCDFIRLMASRVPKLNPILDALDEKDNALRISAKCELKLEASGGLKQGWEKATQITVGSAGNWETEYDKLQTFLQCDAKITGTLTAHARIGVDTWIFEGEAGVEGTVSTGVHFGMREVTALDGKKIQETLYFFEGVELKGKAYLTAGNDQAYEEKTSNPFEASGATSNGIAIGETSSSALQSGGSSNLFEESVKAELMKPVGTKDGWQAVNG